MNFMYVCHFRVFNRPATEVLLSNTHLLKREVEQEIKLKTFDTAVYLKITEYDIVIKAERELE